MTNDRLELAYQYAAYTNRHIFLTGKAGTGKTTFLKRLSSESRKRSIIVAPTGVAAINAGGVTIHSFFQLAPGMYVPDGKTGEKNKDKRHPYNFSKHKINILRSLDLLIIDEVSMVRCDLLDAIDEVLRRYQDHLKPFGGVQLLMIGDMQQLAPVTTENEWEILKQYYQTPYFFESRALRMTSYTTIELTHVFRQSDTEFVRLLNQVRDNCLTAETLRQLNQRYRPDIQPDDYPGYITLTTHNYQAQDINRQRLEQLPTTPQTFEAVIQGEFPESSFPTDSSLELKVGAQVMFCKNDPSPSKQYYNGKIGKVVELSDKHVTVAGCESDDGAEALITVEAQEWQNTRYVTDEQTGEIREQLVGVFRQIPLRAAWAITIHKSQGLTFEHAIINAGHAFSHGQVYVALSRCKTLEGLILSTPITPHVITSDPTIVQFHRFVENNQPNQQQYIQDRRRYVEDILLAMFDFQSILLKLRYLLRLAEEHLAKTFPQFIRALHDTTLMTEKELYEVGMRFRQQIHRLITLADTYEDNPQLQERIAKGTAYFLRKLADVIGDLTETELPDIENKTIREQMERETTLLKQDYDLKMLLFIKCAKGFSFELYWQAKAMSAMQQGGDETGTQKSKTKTKPSEKVKKISVSYNDDILHRPLYQQLRQWRDDMAIERNIAPSSVMHVKTIIGIANTLPTTHRELLAIPGFGKKMLQNYGEELLNIVEQYKKQ